QLAPIRLCSPASRMLPPAGNASPISGIINAAPTSRVPLSSSTTFVRRHPKSELRSSRSHNGRGEEISVQGRSRTLGSHGLTLGLHFGGVVGHQLRGDLAGRELPIRNLGHRRHFRRRAGDEAL